LNPFLLLICLTLAALQLGLPRRWAFLPLLIAACHTPYTPFMGGLTVARVVILTGLMRAGTKGWIGWTSRNPLDVLVVIFAVVAIISTLGHEWHPYNPLLERMRLVMDVGGAYLYGRAYLNDHETLERLGIGLAIVLVPFAFLMFLERMTGINPYSLIGAQNVVSLVRGGSIRAQGPFGTPILSGTVGASSIPILVYLFGQRRRIAIAGLVASLVVIITSGSSGPIGTMMIGLGATTFWRWRSHLKTVVITTVISLIVLHFIKNRPIWYLMALMDFVGGSTGWHRAYLIDSAVEHIGEWWLIGCDFTRHWMPYGLEAVPEHCDITNYYIKLGVTGGLPLVFCLLAIQWKSFRMIGKTSREIGESDSKVEFGLWCVGAALFAHGITFLSISYFDQMYVFFWILIGGLTGFLNLDGISSTSEEKENTEWQPTPSPGYAPEWGRGQANPVVRPSEKAN
jgi:hypothetical protein